MINSRSVVSCFAVMSLFAFSDFCSPQSRNVADSYRSLSGRISMDPYNAPLVQVRVEIRMLGENLTATALSDREGNFRFEGIPSGMYFVAVREPGFNPFEDTVKVDNDTAPLIVRLRKSNPVASASAGPPVSVHELSIPAKARKSFDKGDRLLAVHDPAAGIAEYQRALKSFPDYYEAHYKIGLAEIEREHGPEAETAFRKAIERSDGKFAFALSGLSLVLCVERRFDEAAAAARRNLELDETDPTGHYALGLASYAMGKIPDAEKEVLEALRYRPKFPESYLLLAQVHARQNNPEAVVADLDAYLKLESAGPRAERARTIRAGAQNALLQQLARSSLAQVKQ
jgi:tetratricopeptide (TPR) repeat protein